MAAAAVLLALGVALRGIAGPVPNGHFASIAAIGMAADNMWRWQTVLPIVGYFDHLPVNPTYYMHHPIALFWDVALLGKVFGFSDWVLRLPAVVYVTLTPFLLYRIGRELWGPIEGGLAAIAYVALPITIVYANYHDLEQPYIFGCVVASWGYVRFIHTWRDRYAVASALGFFFALNHAWWGYLWGAFFIPWIFVRGFVLPERWFGAVRARPFGRYCALMCGGMGLALAFEVYLLKESGRLTDVLTSFIVRRGDHPVPLEQVLTSRKYRIELMFTGLAILIGKLAVPVLAARAVLKRRDIELLPVAFLLAAIVHYVAFQQGAAVHIFWPHTFAPYFALAVGALAATVREAIAWLAARVTSWSRRARPQQRHHRGGGPGRPARGVRAARRAVAGAVFPRDRRTVRRGEPGERDRQGRRAALVSRAHAGGREHRLSLRLPVVLGAAVGRAPTPDHPQSNVAFGVERPARLRPRQPGGLGRRSARGRDAVSRSRRRPVLVHRSAGGARAPRRLSLRRARAGLVGAVVARATSSRCARSAPIRGSPGSGGPPSGRRRKRPPAGRRPTTSCASPTTSRWRRATRPARRACARRWPRVSTCRCGPGTRTAPS